MIPENASGRELVAASSSFRVGFVARRLWIAESQVTN